MKVLHMRLILSVMVCFTILDGYAQTKIPKGVNVIIVKGVGFRQAVEELLTRGYSINNIDSSYKTLTTEPLTIKKAAASLVLTIHEKDSVLSIRGRATNLISINVGGFTSKAENFPVENAGGKGSAMRICFELMNEYAKSFVQPIEYKEQ